MKTPPLNIEQKLALDNNLQQIDMTRGSVSTIVRRDYMPNYASDASARSIINKWADGKGNLPANYASSVESITDKSIEMLIGKTKLKTAEKYLDKVTYSLIQSRQGQPKFRDTLLNIYEGKCVITQCATPSALEAAHVVPYAETKSISPDQGLLLRADIHTLFDLYLISINPSSKLVEVDGSCCDYYQSYSGRKVNLNVCHSSLSKHYQRFLDK
ncbi:HNH endonuclease [Colwellia sp. MB3u-4]|uniref:HNH endonuclease n=1 Tax=Colwellia sp. MB3u-4 TaxID=2759822 RepID=UPI0015F7231E|nr:HNH endonuclease signature motif containing protein [Colwellia sp. MB3u-4]MBA6288766.1 HNH endonuclease [Colwellia sp. MB3u-4]